MSLAMLKGKWAPPHNPTTSFACKTIVVTGGNSGIGFETAAKFCSLGASKVILGVRSMEKGTAAKSAIENRLQKTGQIDVWELDMDSYDSIQKFAERASSELDHLEIAVLNAGVIVPKYQQSKYGWEETLQVNTLSTSLLALLLLPKLRASKTATREPVLEIVGSGLHAVAKIPASHRAAILTSFNEQGTYNVHVNYGISKLLVMYTVRTLAKMTAKDPKEPEVIITAVCPGATKSELGRGFDAWYMRIVLPPFQAIFQRSTEEGTRTVVSGTTLGVAGHGQFWSNDEIRPDAPLLKGKEGEMLQEQVWTEIIDALRKDVGNIDSIVDAARGTDY